MLRKTGIAQSRVKVFRHTTVKALMVFDAVNPFTAEGFPIDKLNRLALVTGKFTSALSTPTAVKALSSRFFFFVFKGWSMWKEFCCMDLQVIVQWFQRHFVQEQQQEKQQQQSLLLHLFLLLPLHFLEL